MSKLDDLIDRLVDEMATPGSNRTMYMDDLVTIIEARDALNARLDPNDDRLMSDVLAQLRKCQGCDEMIEVADQRLVREMIAALERRFGLTTLIKEAKTCQT